MFTALKATKLHAEYRASVNNEQPGIEKVCREIIDEQQVNIDYDSLPSYQSEEISIVLPEEEKQRLLYAIQKSNAEFSEIIMFLIEQYQILNDSDLVLLCNKQKSREIERRQENMDYVSNNVTVVREERQDKGAAVLAYDMAMAAKKNKKGKEVKKNA